MATAQRLTDYQSPTKNISAQAALFRWSLTTADATGSAISLPASPDKTVQVFGTFDTGTITIQGSNEFEPTTWATLHDHSGAEITFTAAGIELIAENPLHIRAIATGGAGNIAVTVLLLVKG